MATDPFSILGVDEDASDDEIKRRYLALVRSFPPDREPERFQTYRAAFEALCAPSAIGSPRSCWLSTAAPSRGSRRPVCRRRRRAGTGGFPRPK